VANIADLNSILIPLFRSRSTADWEAAFRSKKALFGPVYKFSEILSHEQVQGSGLITEVEHPTAGKLPHLGPVIRLSDTPGEIQGPAPLLGQHTRQVLKELGYADVTVDDMCRSGVAMQAEPIEAPSLSHMESQ
jgi:crotonobetainyl-CoA:carnitine CoA-transferase CaiB-like acyl-CoA transferase